MNFDVVLARGSVVDGSGAGRYGGDVGIAGGLITAIGDLSSADTRERIDCANHIVAPGFIDIHTHYDAQILWDPALTPSSWYGVTTVVMGNCGLAVAPT